MSRVLALLGALRAALRTRTDLTLENLALRQQLALLRRPTRPRRDFHVQKAAEALPVPANHGLGANEVKRLSPPSPMVGEPHPEEVIEAPELRSLRSAAP